jgi:DNA-directed RNA polymerase subunit RPC12/RpoP
MAATLECPHCGHEESPLRHTYQSNCRGAVDWQGGTLRCQKCDMRIFLFKCDECGRRLGASNVS